MDGAFAFSTGSHQLGMFIIGALPSPSASHLHVKLSNEMIRIITFHYYFKITMKEYRLLVHCLRLVLVASDAEELELLAQASMVLDVDSSVYRLAMTVE